MSFKGFTDTNVDELRKNLKKRANLASEYKEQIDNQQGITNYINKIAIQNSKPIIEALAKEKDERLKATTGVTSEADEKKVLDSNPIAIIEYFRTLRADLLKDNEESEISVLTIPMKLMKCIVEIATNGRDAILNIKGNGGNPDEDIPLNNPLTWLLIFNMKTLKKYNLLKDISDQDIKDYQRILYIANDLKKVVNNKVGELVTLGQQRVKNVVQYPPWEHPDIPKMGFMDFVEYIKTLNKEVPNDPAINALFPARRKKYDDVFTFDVFQNKTKLKISADDYAFGQTRELTIYADNSKENKGNSITLHFPPRVDFADPPVDEKIILKSLFSKIVLLLPNDVLNIIQQILNNSTGNDDLFEKVYDLTSQSQQVIKAVRSDINKINKFVTSTNKSGLGMISQEPEPLYGVLRDPFKDARTVKSRKGNSMHKSYIISGGMFGDLEVNVPKLYTQMHLTAKKGGSVVLDTPVDLDTIELLTKRPKRTRSYSQLAVKNLAKMVKLSDQAVNPNSKKLKMVQKYHSKKRAALPVNADDATIERLTTLILEHQAGNFPNTNLQNEIAQISDTLLKQGMITEKMHKEIYGKYVL